MTIQRVSVDGEAGEPTWTEPDVNGEYVYWDDVYDKLMVWVPVTERMPDKVEKFGYTQRVLVSVRLPHGGTIVRIDNYDPLTKTWLGVDPETQPEVAVTHWMPLPECAV